MKKITLALLLLSTITQAQIVTNGDFQTGDEAPWYNNAANVVDLGASNWVNQAEVTAVGNPYDVNLSQVISLTSGLTYELKFDAFTDTATGTRTLVVGLGQDNAPYAALTATPTLTSTLQTFTYQFTINYGDAVNDRVIFDMGAALGFVFIDNVSVTQIVNTCANGIQDGTETGIDCGGSCAACVGAPLVAAPPPPARNAADVKAIFSDAYPSSNVTVTTFGTDWGPEAASIVDATIEGNATKYINMAAGKVFAGIDFAANKFDATPFTNFHMDYWIENPILPGQVLIPKLSNHDGAGETSAIQEQVIPTGGGWVQLDILLSDFDIAGGESASRNNIAQLVINAARANIGVTSLRIYFDNIYLWRAPLSTNEFAASAIKLYPNPATNVLNIEAAMAVEKVSIFNLLGQEVISQSPNAALVTIDVTSLQIGVYVVKTFINGNISSTRFIKE